MDEGQIVESGSHQELINSDGRYATSWKEQMRRWMEVSKAQQVGDVTA